MRKKPTKPYKNYKNYRNYRNCGPIKIKLDTSTIKPTKYVKCDPTGTALTVFIIGCFVVAAGGAIKIIKNYFDAVSAPVVPIIKEIIPGSITATLALVCPKPEVREVLLSLDPTVLRALCASIDMAKVTHAWLEHLKIPYLESLPKINSADPSALAHFYHELLRWSQAQNFNENAWKILNRVESHVRVGIFENGRLLRARSLTNEVIFCKSTDFAPCPREYLKAFTQPPLELHPRHFQTGDGQRWALHNENQFSRRGAVVALTKKNAHWYINGSSDIWNMYLNQYIEHSARPDQLAAFRDTILNVDKTVYDENRVYKTSLLWDTKSAWIENYCIENPVDYSTIPSTTVKTPNDLKELNKYLTTELETVWGGRYQ